MLGENPRWAERAKQPEAQSRLRTAARRLLPTSLGIGPSPVPPFHHPAIDWRRPAPVKFRQLAWAHVGAGVLFLGIGAEAVYKAIRPSASDPAFSPPFLVLAAIVVAAVTAACLLLAYDARGRTLTAAKQGIDRFRTKAEIVVNGVKAEPDTGVLWQEGPDLCFQGDHTSMRIPNSAQSSAVTRWHSFLDDDHRQTRYPTVDIDCGCNDLYVTVRFKLRAAHPRLHEPKFGDLLDAWKSAPKKSGDQLQMTATKSVTNALGWTAAGFGAIEAIQPLAHFTSNASKGNWFFAGLTVLFVAFATLGCAIAAIRCWKESRKPI